MFATVNDRVEDKPKNKGRIVWRHSRPRVSCATRSRLKPSVAYSLTLASARSQCSGSSPRFISRREPLSRHTQEIQPNHRNDPEHRFLLCSGWFVGGRGAPARCMRWFVINPTPNRWRKAGSMLVSNIQRLNITPVPKSANSGPRRVDHTAQCLAFPFHAFAYLATVVDMESHQGCSHPIISVSFIERDLAVRQVLELIFLHINVRCGPKFIPYGVPGEEMDRSGGL